MPVQLFQLVVVVLALSLALGAAFRVYSHVTATGTLSGDWSAGMTAAVVGVIVLAALCVRSTSFGVDTEAYVELLRGYCADQREMEPGVSYRLSLAIMSALMGGGCREELLPAAWAISFVGVLFLAHGSLLQRVLLVSLVLVSLVGIELTTNALRQGLSVAVLVVAVSQWQRRPLVFLSMSILACLLHTSSILVLGAFLMATLGPAMFMLGAGAILALILWGIGHPESWSIAGPFLYEITKYMGHEGDELYVRLLAGASLLSVCLAAFVVSSANGSKIALLRDESFAIAVRLGLTAIPFLLLPYFGYRYIYGVLPVALWLTLSAVRKSGGRFSWYSVVLALANAVILLVWSYGSAYMREVPFLYL